MVNAFKSTILKCLYFNGALWLHITFYNYKNQFIIHHLNGSSNAYLILHIAMISEPHSSTLAWKIPWMEEPSRLQSMGSLRVRQDWANSLSLFTFHFHALEKEMATHSSVLAWRIPGMGEPGGLPRSRGSHRVWHDWSDLAAAAAAWSLKDFPVGTTVKKRLNPWIRKIPWRRKWQPTPVFLPGESHQRSLVVYSSKSCKECMLLP